MQSWAASGMPEEGLIESEHSKLLVQDLGMFGVVVSAACSTYTFARSLCLGSSATGQPAASNKLQHIWQTASALRYTAAKDGYIAPC